MRFEDDSCNMSEDNGLGSKLLSIVCCRNGCRHAVGRALGACGDCCAHCWLGGDGRSKQEIEYVIERRTSSGSVRGHYCRDDEEAGYDNEACMERERRAMLLARGEAKDIKSELYHRIEARRSSSITATPIIDWKAVEFWTACHRETVQPVAPGGGGGRDDVIVHGFRPQLYEDEKATSHSDLSDEEKLEKYGLGQVHFSVRYEVAGRMLLVKVISARDLARPLRLDDARTDMAHSNPYVRVCLLPDQKSAHVTAVKQKTQCPVFGETFAFELPFAEVQMRVLQLKVKDFDKYSRHCVLGHVLLPLVNINLVKGRHMWKPLVPCEKEQQDLGDIFISLNYLPSAGRLNVIVIKAKQLLQMDLTGSSVPFVRISLALGNKLWKSKKTSCKKNTLNPVFNESFSFHVSPSELRELSVVLSAWDKDNLIGRIVLGQFASGPDEVTHWERMIHSHRQPIAQWHTLRSRQECDGISPASAIVP